MLKGCFVYTLISYVHLLEYLCIYEEECIKLPGCVPAANSLFLTEFYDSH